MGADRYALSMEIKQVRAGTSTILSPSERTSVVDILAELVWNSLDAEAMRIELTVESDAMGAPAVIEVRDDGHGFSYEQAQEQFLTHGESWKKESRFSPNKRRPLHGRFGRGRFLAYGIAETIEWLSVSKTDDGYASVLVSGSLSTPNKFSFAPPLPSLGPGGTTVTMRTRQRPKVAQLADKNPAPQLTARFAASLLGLPEVAVTYCGESLDPRTHITEDVFLDLDLKSTSMLGESVPRLRVVEWSGNMQSKVLYLCDAEGGAVTQHTKLPPTPPVPIHWTAYLLWDGFRDPALMTMGDLHVPDIRHAELLAAAHRALVDYLNRRFDERKGSILAEWKSEGVYPYHGTPKSAAEEVQREIFDIVAVVASPAIGTEVQQRKLSLQLLQQATSAEPTRTNKILNAVLDLEEEEQEVLGELLERTKLTSIVQAAKTIADRSDFLGGLRRMLYSDQTRKEFREVDQLHPLLVNEPWIFGDEWHLSFSETGLTRLISTILSQTKDIEFSSEPVKLPSGKKGRVDMVFSRHLPESDRMRHLVVELKRPKPITGDEFMQVNNYATAITSHPEVKQTSHVWDFWLIGTEVSPLVQNLYSDSTRPGLTTNNPSYKLWVMTWGQLLDQADRRLQAFRDSLDLASNEETSRAYLQRKYAEFIPPLAST
jgi:hypothetical protein